MTLFNPRVKTPVHTIYILLVIAAMGLSVPRLFMKNQPRTRANTIALGMASHPHLHAESPTETSKLTIAKGRQIPILHRIPDLHGARTSPSSLAKLQSLLDPECARGRVLGGCGRLSHAVQSCQVCWDRLQTRLGRCGCGCFAQVCGLSDLVKIPVDVSAASSLLTLRLSASLTVAGSGAGLVVSGLLALAGIIVSSLRLILGWLEVWSI